MQASQGSVGRIFVLRLEDGDTVPDCIETFARKQEIRVAHVALLGGIGAGEVVSGPRRSDQRPPEPMRIPVDGAHEALGVGFLAPDEAGDPVLHLHAALGRGGQTLTGCTRPGVEAWLVGEVVLYEILGADVVRRADPAAGLSLLEAGRNTDGEEGGA
jgi:predicted DNA-binding protein with PD1-like motif